MIEELLVFPRRDRTAIPGALRRLRAERYDAVLDLHGNLKSAVHARLARSPRRIGYAAPIAREGASRFYHEAVHLDGRSHRADQGYHLLRALGLSGEKAKAILPPFDESSGSPAADVVLHPGTSEFARFKRWPIRHYAELAERLTARGVSVAVSIGPGEQLLAAHLQRAVPNIGVVDGADVGLGGLAAAYRAARVVVAADTGPLHLAAAAGTPVVAMFGPKDPAIYGPRGEHHQVLRNKTPCQPCRRRSCSSPLCILGIAVSDVDAAVDAVLQPSVT